MSRQQVPNYELQTDTARLNLLTNGGFEIWQRGTGPFTAVGVHSADRWVVSPGGSSTMSVSRDGTNIDPQGGGQYSAAVTYTHNAESFFYQPLYSESTHLRGRTISASVRVRTSTANAVRLAIYDGVYTYGAFHTGDGTWQTLTVTRAVSGSQCDVRIAFDASCTAYVDNAMLVVGSVPADYAPLHPADDLARCLRYYERVGDGSEILIAGWSGAASEAIGGFLRWTRKAVTPTVTNSGTWGTVNCNQPVTASGTVAGCQLYTTSTASGHVQFTSSGSAYQTVEANP